MTGSWKSQVGRRRERARRARFFRRAAGMTPYVAVELGSEVLFLSTGDALLQGGVFTRRSRSDISFLAKAVALLARSGARAPSDSVFLEVGAHIGTTTVMALRRHGFASAVVLEPSPANLWLLRINLAANELADRVLALPVAASDHEGELPFDTLKRNTGGHRIATATAPESGLRVPVVTLDRLVEDDLIDPQQVGLVWIDAAGDEAGVLLGATTLLQASVPIAVELRPQRMHASTKDALHVLLTRHYTSFWRKDEERHRPIGEVGAVLEASHRISVLLS